MYSYICIGRSYGHVHLSCIVLNRLLNRLRTVMVNPTRVHTAHKSTYGIHQACFGGGWLVVVGRGWLVGGYDLE